MLREWNSFARAVDSSSSKRTFRHRGEVCAASGAVSVIAIGQERNSEPSFGRVWCASGAVVYLTPPFGRKRIAQGLARTQLIRRTCVKHASSPSLSGSVGTVDVTCRNECERMLSTALPLATQPLINRHEKRAPRSVLVRNGSTVPTSSNAMEAAVISAVNSCRWSVSRSTTSSLSLEAGRIQKTISLSPAFRAIARRVLASSEVTFDIAR